MKIEEEAWTSLANHLKGGEIVSLDPETLRWRPALKMVAGNRMT